MGPRAQFQDGDQPAVQVERPHFWFFYISLVSGQYRLLMGQKRHSLMLGTFLGASFAGQPGLSLPGRVDPRRRGGLAVFRYEL